MPGGRAAVLAGAVRVVLLAAVALVLGAVPVFSGPPPKPLDKARDELLRGQAPPQDAVDSEQDPAQPDDSEDGVEPDGPDVGEAPDDAPDAAAVPRGVAATRDEVETPPAAVAAGPLVPGRAEPAAPAQPAGPLQ